MIPTNRMMDRALYALVILLCSVLVSADHKNSDCPNCELCPIDDQGCCFTQNKTLIANGDYYIPDIDPFNSQQKCANFTCVNGHFQKEYYCPITDEAIGTGCYGIGPRKMPFFEAQSYCNIYGGDQAYDLATLDTVERAINLAEDIKPLILELVKGDMEGVFWLGSGAYWDGQQSWYTRSGMNLADGYSNLIGPPFNGGFIAAYAKQGHAIDMHWFYKREEHLAYPLCQRRWCNKPKTCSYNGRTYNPEEIISRDPNCECSWIECGEYGQIKAIEKKKPCCSYNGEVFGNGEEVFIDKCSRLVCEEGKLVSYPYCASESLPNIFVPLTYNSSSSCYAYISKHTTYEEAMRFCASHDSKLAEITSKGENEAVENFLSNLLHLTNGQHQFDLWLGGRAEVCENGKLGHFHWTSAESRRLPVEAVYEDFCDGQPKNDTGAQCLQMTYTGQKNENCFCWSNSVCHKKKPFLCEKCASCEHVYKNVCYNNEKQEFAVNGALVDAGYDPHPGSYGLRTCYEKRCENGKILTRNSVCDDTHKQVPPTVSRKGKQELSGNKKVDH